MKKTDTEKALLARFNEQRKTCKEIREQENVVFELKNDLKNAKELLEKMLAELVGSAEKDIQTSLIEDEGGQENE